MLRATVYRGRGNTVDFQLLDKGAAVTLEFVTRVVVEMGASVVDSAINPEAFDLTNKQKVILKFGGLDLPLGEFRTKVTVYSYDQPQGILWVDDLAIIVSEG